MVITKRAHINGHYYMHNYSDKGVYIERDGVLYQDALDPVGSERTYTETETKIPEMEEEEDENIH